MCLCFGSLSSQAFSGHHTCPSPHPGLCFAPIVLICILALVKKGAAIAAQSGFELTSSGLQGLLQSHRLFFRLLQPAVFARQLRLQLP